MERWKNAENVTQNHESQQDEKVYGILKIIDVVLALVALILAVALTVTTLLFQDLQGQRDQLEKIQASNEDLRAKNNESWEDAESFCTSLGSHLTSVTSVQEQEFIYKKTDGSNYWIGLNTLKSSSWSWIDGTPFNKAKSDDFWSPGEPNNKGNNENCVHFAKNKLQSWNDNDCSLPFLFICKWNCKSSAFCP
ncbi:C-type lectin domain family 4 member K-like [Macrotis lagotis]|uniref:C-type lectin domain family 4 member K-like n=1 Tax=Macrotis lagotis TaxID=92651 RepID=UPI003D68922A